MMEWWYPETTHTCVEYIRSVHCQREEKSLRNLLKITFDRLMKGTMTYGFA